MSDLKTAQPPNAVGEESLEKAVARLAGVVARLGAGPLAELRRSTPETGSAAFWRVYHASALEQRIRESDADWEWVAVALALLTRTSATRGEAVSGNPRHDPKLPLGAALRSADISELRLSKILNAPFAQRRDAILRLVRRLARTEQRFNFPDLARLLLYPKPEAARLRDLAKSYYAAEAREKQKEKHDV